MDKHGKTALIIGLNRTKLDEIERVMSLEGWGTEIYQIPADMEDWFFLEQLDAKLPLPEQIFKGKDLVVCDIQPTDKESWYLTFVLAIRCQLPHLPVVAIKGGRYAHDFLEALKGIGVYYVSWGWEFLPKIAPSAGKRRVFDLRGIRIMDSQDSSRVEGYGFELPIPGVSDDNPAIKRMWDGFLSWIDAKNPLMEMSLPPLWLDYSPQDNGDLARLRRQMSKTMPQTANTYYPSRPWLQEYWSRYMEAAACFIDSKREHALYAAPGINVVSMCGGSEFRHRLAHIVVTGGLLKRQRERHFPTVKAILDRMLGEDADFSHDEFGVWEGYDPSKTADDLSEIVKYNFQKGPNAMKHWSECPFRWK